MSVPKSPPRRARFVHPRRAIATMIATAMIATVVLGAALAAAPVFVHPTASTTPTTPTPTLTQGAASCLPLTARNPDGNYIVPGVHGAIVYRRIGATELFLDAYVQPGGGRARPGVVVLHGGGWERGSRAAFTGQFLELLTRAGYNWVSVDYRLGSLANYEQAVEDVHAALAFVRCHARELEIDPARLVLWGEDTGAQLAALVASRASSGVRAMVLVGGIYDLHAFASIPRGSPTELVLRASPSHRVRRGMPSTLLVHGTADSEVPLTQARRYCAELQTMRAACDIVEVDGASHRAENWWPSQWGYKPRIVDWLSRTLSFTASATSRVPSAAPPTEPTTASSPGSTVASSPGSTVASPPGSTAAPTLAQPTVAPTSVQTAGLHKDIVFSPAHGLKLDAYIPAVQDSGTGPFPAVIIAHGGGWEAGDKVTYVTPLFEPLAKAGFAWFSIDYRLTPEVLHPAQLDDLRDAIRFVRSNASRFNIDPKRIALLGESASGQMVMQVAAESANGPPPRAGRDSGLSIAAVVSFYGVYDFEPMVEESPSPPRSLLWRLFRLPTLDVPARAVLRAHSPIHHVRRGMPPVLLIHGTKDRLWTQGQSMSRVLKDRGIPHELIPLEGAPHGLENWEGHAPWMHYKTRLVTWLRDNLW